MSTKSNNHILVASGRGLVTIGDSLSLPRPWDEQSAHSPDECWPDLVASRELFKWHWHIGIPGGSLRDGLKILLRYGDYLSERTLALIVLQFGIVDSTPRQFPRVVDKGLTAVATFLGLEKARRKIGQLKVLYRLWGRPWVRRSSFRKTVKEVLAFGEKIGVRICFVEIGEPGDRLRRVTGKSNTADFNRIIWEEVARTQSGASVVTYRPHYLADGHHLTAGGHSSLAESVLRHLEFLSVNE